MTPNNQRNRKHHRPIHPRYPPPHRYRIRREHDHPRRRRHAQHQRQPEPLQYLGDLEPEVGALDFLFCRAPGDVVGEEVRAEGLREVDAEAAEEEEAARVARNESQSIEHRAWVSGVGAREKGRKYAQERHPLHILKQRVQQRAVPQPVLEEGEPDVARAGEDDRAGEPDLEAVDEEPVHRRAPPEEEVVHEGEGEACRDSVCSEVIGLS